MELYFAAFRYAHDNDGDDGDAHDDADDDESFGRPFFATEIIKC